MTKLSPLVRITCGILGIGGIAAAAGNAVAAASMSLDLTMLGALFGGFVFIFAAIFGVAPWESSNSTAGSEGRMTPDKWKMFWGIELFFLLFATFFLWTEGVFREANIVILGIIAFVFLMVGVALYFFLKSQPSGSSLDE